MADRVSVSIMIGGALSPAAYADLSAIIALEGLSVEWDGEPFEPEHHIIGKPLTLCAHEVAWGRLDNLERYCTGHQLPFVRWSGGCPGQWSPERRVFIGTGAPVSYTVDENDRVQIDRWAIEKCGNMAAVLGYFEAADFAVPPLVVGGNLPPAAIAGSGPAGETGNG